jgi:DNA-binding NarL/FixJ family response regulator
MTPPTGARSGAGAAPTIRSVSGALVVDPDPLLCEALASALPREGLPVVAWTTDEENATAIAHERRPDVVLTEIELANGSGFSLARKLRDRVPTVILTRMEEGDVLLHAAAAGAAGCLGHGMTVPSLRSLIATGLATGFAVDPLRLRMSLVRAASRDREDSTRGIARMTPREREVLRLIGLGLGNDAIAAKLYLSPATVRTHVGRILRKLGAHSRAEAARVAVRTGETGTRDATRIVGPDLGT